MARGQPQYSRFNVASLQLCFRRGDVSLMSPSWPMAVLGSKLFGFRLLYAGVAAARFFWASSTEAAAMIVVSGSLNLVRGGKLLDQQRLQPLQMIGLHP